jgi:oligopeptide transport system substrate-binding protein
VSLDKIKILEVESYNTTLNLYRTGDLDWLGSNGALPSEFMDHLQTFKDFKRDPYLSVYFYWINTQAPPMDNVLVRKALALSIDRTAITTHITRSGQIPTADLVPDGLAGYRGLKRPLFNPEEARALLAQAGYPNGRNLPSITLIYNTSEGHKQIAEAVQAMWKKHLNIDVKIENQEWKVFLKNLQMQQFQIARMGWVGDYPDPNTFLHDLLTTHSGNNHSNWKNKVFDAQVDAANSLSDPAQRLEGLRKAEAIAMDAQPLIPFYVYTRAYMTKPYVKGIWSNYQDHHPFKYMSIDPTYETRGK